MSSYCSFLNDSPASHLHISNPDTIDLTNPLMNASPEIHLLISYHLDPLDLVSFKVTNRYFHHTLPPLNERNLSQAQDLLYRRRDRNKQSIPGTPIVRALRPYLACMSCHRLRLSDKFADDQLRTYPLLKPSAWVQRQLPVKSYSRLKRFCIECGVKGQKPGYEAGATIQVEEKKYRVCLCAGVPRDRKRVIYPGALLVQI